MWMPRPYIAGLLLFSLLAATVSGQETKKPLDRSEDSLPEGALLRMGSSRLWHDTWLTDLAFSPDDKNLAAADSNGAIRLWDVETGRASWELPKKTGSNLAISPDGKLLATGGYYQSEITLWNMATREPVRRFKQNGRSLAFSRDSRRLVAAGSDGILRLWNPETGELIRAYKGHEGALYAVAISPDGKFLASGGGGDGTAPHHNEVRLWDADSDQELARFEEDDGQLVGLKGWVYSVAFSADGQRLAAATPYAVRVWDIARRKQLVRFGESSYDVAFSPLADRLVMPGDFGVFDPATGKQTLKLSGDVGVYGRVAWSHDGATIASGNQLGRVQFWDAQTGKEKVRRNGHELGVRAVALSPDGSLAASLSRADGTLRLWGTASGKQLRKFEVAWAGSDVHWSKEGNGLFFPPYGREVGTWTYDGTLRFWDLAGGQVRAVKVGKRSIVDAALSHDGNIIAVAEYDGSRPDIGIYEMDGGRRLKLLQPFGNYSGSDAWMSCLAFSPDGNSLAIGIRQDAKYKSSPDEKSEHETIQLWDVAEGDLTRSFRRNVNAPGALVFSPDGKWVASAATGNTPVQLWNVADGSEVRSFALKDVGRSWYESSPLAFSTDSKTLAAAARNFEIVLWELAGGLELQRLAGHTKAVTSLAFSPDGQTLLSGSEDATVLLWDVAGASKIAGGPMEKPDATRLEASWHDLASSQGDVVARAMASLSAAPEQATALLRSRLKPLPEPDASQFPGLIADLGHPEAAQRAKAAEALKQAGGKAAPALYKALQSVPGVELRREIEGVLEVVGEFPIPPEKLRQQRAIAILERIGTPDAEQLLQTLAGAERATDISREAQAALDRLKQRRKAPATKIQAEDKR